MRGSVSHINAKYTPRKVNQGFYQTAVISVLYRLVLIIRTKFSFSSAPLIKQYFGIWSSVYLQLLQYFILFLLPLQWWTILVITIKEKKKNYINKRGMLYNFQEMQVHAHLNHLHLCHTIWIHMEFEWYWCLYVWIWLNKI